MILETGSGGDPEGGLELPVDLFKVFMAPSAGEAVLRTLYSGYVGQGPQVETFELELGAFLGTDHACTVNSGTSALHLALHLLRRPDGDWPGLTEGDEVLTTPLTCTATNWPILANGLSIRWCDIDPENFNVDLDDLARKLTSKTKVVLVVHWGGYPVDLDRLDAILDQAAECFGFRARVVEDCAHAMGSRYKGRHVGMGGNFGCFSFQAIKHVTSVDGGCLVAPTTRLYRRAKLVRWYGIDRETSRKDFRCEADVEEWGYKFHMNDVCATVGIENLRHAGEIVALHRRNAACYDEELREVAGVSLPRRSPGHESSFWLYSMQVEDKPGFMAAMKARGVVASQVHERNDRHTCVREFRTLLPNLDEVVPRLVSIPVGWWVTPAQREHVVASVRAGW